MNIPITWDDVIYAAALAFFFTWLINNISKIFRIAISRSTEFDYDPKDLNKMLQKCYILFPKDIVLFHGKTFKRGMNIRIITNQNKMFEGQFIGLNSENMLCVLTTRHVIAHELDSIDEIVLLER